MLSAGDRWLNFYKFFGETGNWLKLILALNNQVEAGSFRFRKGEIINVVSSAQLMELENIFVDKHFGYPRNNKTIVDVETRTGAFALYMSRGLGNKILAVEKTTPELTAKNITQSRRQINLDKTFVGEENNPLSKELSLEAILNNNSLEKIDLLHINCHTKQAYDLIYKTRTPFLKTISEFCISYTNIPDVAEYDMESLVRFLGMVDRYKMKKLFTLDNSRGTIWLERV